ncbi:MAG: NADH-quinone oxidoreductase subunit G [Gammaproteobacteria bacterium]|nr:NADH-quinone oxidoreductase subunit G [Gammaproteobacteria bacterium]NIR82807.1 NADH-quinone oxidoreductase subunit G [Gammaproteobacteria bacterium]NIR89916.1 NADH-quinone oxidoreductase subunit G [Gammaproteobacteria bacterium]NIU03965.1 NADH-quinone oxidoreductase subunit G [Gammaproteobacteria bacterium]NIV51285.1 NADH-quinone oxidoreductase subunit G [Gammaproteobacteria bacterium]
MSEDTVNIEVNGVSLQGRKGQMLIEVTDAAGVFVPRFCYHKKLSVAANCRMCLVEVEKAPKPLPACATPLAEGMKVHTRSPLALRAQKSVMEFLLINHPLDCPICDQGGECELQDVAMGYGRGVSRFQERKRSVKDKNIGPLIATDMTRCIHCTRCVRFGIEIGGVQELGATGRSEHMEIGTFVERSVDSEVSGNVIDLCPVGALTNKPFRFRARAWEMKQVGAVAPHDCVGSNVDLHVVRNRVMRAVPRENEGINETWISDRDRWGLEGLYSDERLQAPCIKREGDWQTVDWEDALAFAREGLKRVVAQQGPGQIGALAGPSATLEEHYLLQKFMRGLGSPHVDHRLRQSDFSDQEAAPLFPWLGQRIAELEKVGAALLVGSWIRKEQPLLNQRLRKAALRGARVMAVNAVDYDFNFPLAERIITHPAAMARSLAGIARALGEEAGAGAGGEAERLLGGVVVDETHRAMARHLLGAERATILLGPAAGAHPEAAVLRALAGHIATRARAILGHLSEGANSAGAWLAGAVPHRGPGGEPSWPEGFDAATMLRKGLRAYLLLDVEPELDCADAHRARQAMTAADFVVALTPYRTAAMEEYANVLLPTAPFAETPGTFVNVEGTWQSFDAVTRPYAEARPAWKVLRVLGNHFEVEGFEYMECSEVREELRAIVGGRTPSNDGAWRIPEALAGAQSEEAGKALYRIGDVALHAGDPLVRRSKPLQQTADALESRAAARMNASLAERLGLSAGERVTVAQNGVRASLEVIIERRVPDGCVYVHANSPGSAGLGPAYGPIEIEKA